MRDNNKDKRLEKKQLLAIREKVASLLVDVELITFMVFSIRVIIVQFVVERYNK